ncbi:MAG: TraR/DksA family transcriptional regulator [Bdellovibrionales bacterium]|nr:TraR/DksA family transcriptional regulator [Bdellovibrionales bacterium]
MLDKTILSECRQKLIATKADLLNRFQNHFSDFRQREHGGDEADQTMSLQAENQLFATHQRLRQQLSEIENALMRIEKGTFGICEETEEPIEKERLLAIPWTRLSIEGAEIRESNSQGRGA